MNNIMNYACMIMMLMSNMLPDTAWLFFSLGKMDEESGKNEKHVSPESGNEMHVSRKYTLMIALIP